MYEAGTLVVLVLGAGHVDQGDAVVFIIVSDEGEVVVGVDDFAAEEVDVEALHVLEAAGA